MASCEGVSSPSATHCLPGIHFEESKNRAIALDELVTCNREESTDSNVVNTSFIEECNARTEVPLGNAIIHHDIGNEQSMYTFLEDEGASQLSNQPNVLLPTDNSKEDVFIYVDLSSNTVKQSFGSSKLIKDKSPEEYFQSISEVSCDVDKAIESILTEVASRDSNNSENTNVHLNSSTSPQVLPSKINKKSHQENLVKRNKSFDEEYRCKVCGKTFREKSHLASHFRAHVEIRNFSCDICGLRFKTETNLRFHFQTHSVFPFTCKECNKTFRERKILKRHIRVVHSSKAFHKCTQCDKTFKSATNLASHYALHSGSKPFNCKMCPKSFVHKSTLEQHISQKHRCTSCNPSECTHYIRNWLCPVCGKGYSLKGTLNAHLKTHDPDKVFRCTQCPKSFAKKQSYEIHIKWHAGEGPQYMCDQCSRSYFSVFALRRHYVKHTSERKFICEVCSKAFWMKDALKVHKRSHTNIKPFQCSICPKAFGHKHTLESHIKNHNSERTQTNRKKVPSSPEIPTFKSTALPPATLIPAIVATESCISADQILYYQLPTPVQAPTHIVFTQNDRSFQQTLHVL